jgi:hypothetical protein
MACGQAPSPCRGRGQAGIRPMRAPSPLVPLARIFARCLRNPRLGAFGILRLRQRARADSAWPARSMAAICFSRAAISGRPWRENGPALLAGIPAPPRAAASAGASSRMASPMPSCPSACAMRRAQPRRSRLPAFIRA